MNYYATPSEEKESELNKKLMLLYGVDLSTFESVGDESARAEAQRQAQAEAAAGSQG